MPIYKDNFGVFSYIQLLFLAVLVIENLIISRKILIFLYDQFDIYNSKDPNRHF